MNKKSKANRYAAHLQRDLETEAKNEKQAHADFKKMEAIRSKLEATRRLHENLEAMVSKGHSRDCKCYECFGLRIEARKTLAIAMKRLK